MQEIINVAIMTHKKANPTLYTCPSGVTLKGWYDPVKRIVGSSEPCKRQNM